MNIRRPFYCYFAAFSCAILATAGVVSAATLKGDLALLDTLERGMWQLRPTGDSAPMTKICLGKSDDFIQIEHSGLACERYVVRSNANSVTVSYSCSGEGQGTTTIRKESSRIVHLQSQGITNKGPFSITAEARRLGPC